MNTEQPSKEQFPANQEHHYQEGIRGELMTTPSNELLELEKELEQELENIEVLSQNFDILAHAVADFFGEDIGEHSSANDPWLNAIDLVKGKTLESHSNQKVREAVEEAKSLVLRRTEIPRDAVNPTRDAIVEIGEVLAELIQTRLIDTLSTNNSKE